MQRVIVYFAFKIKDGLYIGNQRSPHEKEFVIQNKITHIVNCASSQIKINPQIFGVKVLAFDWLDTDDQVILDDKNDSINMIYDFIEEASDECEGILICSQRGQSRSLTILTAYMMRKYQWSLYKTLQFMNSKRVDFEIRAVFLKQLLAYEQRIFQDCYCSKEWIGFFMSFFFLNSILLDISEVGEALLIKNTYLNSSQKQQQQSQKEFSTPSKQKRTNSFQRIKWAETLTLVIGENSPQQRRKIQKTILKYQPTSEEDKKIETTPMPIKPDRQQPTFQSFDNFEQQPSQQVQQQPSQQVQQQQQQVQLNINFNVGQLNIINSNKANNFLNSTPKFQQNQPQVRKQNFMSNQPRRSNDSQQRSTSYNVRPNNSQAKQISQQHFQYKKHPPQTSEFLLYDQAMPHTPVLQQQKQNKISNQIQNTQQLFEIYLENGPITMGKNQPQSKNIKPRQLTPIQIKPALSVIGPPRSVSQNQNKKTKLEEDDFTPSKNNSMNSAKADSYNGRSSITRNVMISTAKGRDKRFQMRR